MTMVLVLSNDIVLKRTEVLGATRLGWEILGLAGRKRRRRRRERSCIHDISTEKKKTLKEKRKTLQNKEKSAENIKQ